MMSMMIDDHPVPKSYRMPIKGLSSTSGSGSYYHCEAAYGSEGGDDKVDIPGFYRGEAP
ncbi:hypothetical protein CC1G_05646 [Coprinopsis cinerea okayama7|uniref:Uncharacterized protein n=1 Tax=Coprinopsis cinerea (strain Okayama-7 / 130 / ATCC MYA-4618 / FGSC 9003) TaxID=240176 RepID=A8P1S4_COPC7|nr:hypothetical protein CC1G_05646 [Coprinopsis cinerea okayama7\|eukprot:XP_001838165.2 hypothetical protein CC1G_05646 [Coprinopsis cinerea okayama7\